MTFGIRPVPEPPPPLRRRGSFTTTPGEDPEGEPVDPSVRVYVAEDVRRALAHERAFSLTVEEGGFLFGRVYRDEESPERYLVEITHAVPAEHTGATVRDLTFTPDSFSSMQRRLQAEGSDVRLVGWYHTHLFAATASLGLSRDDDELHVTTFRSPWQIAGLVNLDLARDPGGRVLRFYVRRRHGMVRCPEEVVR